VLKFVTFGMWLSSFLYFICTSGINNICTLVVHEFINVVLVSLLYCIYF
jgi:hypothetical protein